MASKSISPKIKKENDVITIEGFATKVGIQSIVWNDDYHRVVVDYVNDNGQTVRESIYDKNYSTVNWKSEASKLKSIQYQINMFASLCQSVKPDLKLVDTADLQTAYEEYAQQIAHLLPSPCEGELKLIFREAEGQYYKCGVSRDTPVYSNEVKKMKVVFSDYDKTKLSFKVVVPVADVETAPADSTEVYPIPTEEVGF